MAEPREERDIVQTLIATGVVVLVCWSLEAMLRPDGPGADWALEVVEYENGVRRSRASSPKHAAELAELVELLGGDGDSMLSDTEEQP